MSNAERVRRYYQNNKEKVLEKQRRRRAADPERAREVSRRNERQRKFRRYGITEEIYTQMLTNQNFVCAICEQPNTNSRDWHVDHNHTTGKVRGILCHHCNVMLGHAKDSIETLSKAVSYLVYHQ